LDPGDYLELWVENNSGATNFALKDANIVVRV